MFAKVRRLHMLTVMQAHIRQNDGAACVQKVCTMSDTFLGGCCAVPHGEASLRERQTEYAQYVPCLASQVGASSVRRKVRT